MSDDETSDGGAGGGTDGPRDGGGADGPRDGGGADGPRDGGGADGPRDGGGTSGAEGDFVDCDERDPSTEDEIRWAAFEVLAEQGFDSFTTQAVADAAGVSQSLVHYYFDTKSDLVFAMFSSGLDHLTAEIEARVDADDPRERLLELTRYVLRSEDSDEFDEAVEFSRMLLEVEAQAPYDERLRETVAYDTVYLRDYVADAVREGVESGQFRPVDPEPFAAAFLGALRSGQNLRAVFASDDHVEPVRRGVEGIVDGYLLAADP